MIVTQGSSEVAQPLLQGDLDPQHFEHVFMFDRSDDAIEVCEERILELARAREQRGTGSDDDSFLDAVFADVMNALDMQEENGHLYFILGGLVALERVDPHGGAARVGRLGRWNLVGDLGSLLDYREPFTARIQTREGFPDAGQFLARLGRSSRCPLGLTVP